MGVPSVRGRGALCSAGPPAPCSRETHCSHCPPPLPRRTAETCLLLKAGPAQCPAPEKVYLAFVKQTNEESNIPKGFVKFEYMDED